MQKRTRWITGSVAAAFALSALGTHYATTHVIGETVCQKDWRVGPRGERIEQYELIDGVTHRRLASMEVLGVQEDGSKVGLAYVYPTPDLEYMDTMTVDRKAGVCNLAGSNGGVQPAQEFSYVGP